jgi:membrane protease YdiL (CAAX protease family)
MSEDSQLLIIQAIVVGIGAIIAAAIVSAGLWRPSAFAAAPNRPIGLKGGGLLIGMALYLFGNVMVTALAWVADTNGLPTLMRTEELSPRHYAVWMLIGQVLTTGLMAMAFACIALLARGPRGLREAGFVPRAIGRESRAAALGALVALILVFAVNIVVTVIASQLGYETPELAHEMLIVFREATSDPPAMALLLLSAVVAAPLLEETVFRGLVQSELLSMLGSSRRSLVIVIASVLFMAVHIPVAQWQTWPGLFTLALVLGWLYERYGSLAVCIAVHMVFNATNVGLMFALKIGETPV